MKCQRLTLGTKVIGQVNNKEIDQSMFPLINSFHINGVSNKQSHNSG